jgi:hypothetical protein
MHRIEPYATLPPALLPSPELPPVLKHLNSVLPKRRGISKGKKERFSHRDKMASEVCLQSRDRNAQPEAGGRKPAASQYIYRDR